MRKLPVIVALSMTTTALAANPPRSGKLINLQLETTRVIDHAKRLRESGLQLLLEAGDEDAERHKRGAVRKGRYKPRTTNELPFTPIKLDPPD